jgi:hypothetical protein
MTQTVLRTRITILRCQATACPPIDSDRVLHPVNSIGIAIPNLRSAQTDETARERRIHQTVTTDRPC